MSKQVVDFLWDNKIYFSKGKRGFIYLSSYKNKKFVIKVKNPDSSASNIVLREFENNVLLNKHGIGPMVFYFDSERDFLIREFVDGVSFFDWVKTVKSKHVLLKFFLNVLDQCKVMDSIGLNKFEMNRPHKDLLVVNDLPVIIDFERCKLSVKPKNVTQFIQFVLSGNLKKYLLGFGVLLNRDRLIFLSNSYKSALKKGDCSSNGDLVFVEINKLKDELSASF